MPCESSVPEGFMHCMELLFYNVGVELNRNDIKKDLRERCKGIVFTRIRTIYYHGRYSVIVRLDSDLSAYFVYWHFKRNVSHFRSTLGDGLEVFKVVSNELDSPKPADWVAVVLRNLPGFFDRHKLNRLLFGVVHRSEEEPILLNEKKHAMVYFNDIESAIEGMAALQIRMKDTQNFRVNLHPDFAKNCWRSLDSKTNPYAGFYGDTNSNAAGDDTNHSYSRFVKGTDEYYIEENDAPVPASTAAGRALLMRTSQ